LAGSTADRAAGVAVSWAACPQPAARRASEPSAETTVLRRNGFLLSDAVDRLSDAIVSSKATPPQGRFRGGGRLDGVWLGMDTAAADRTAAERREPA
jgi:hypothetical protein